MIEITKGTDEEIRLRYLTRYKEQNGEYISKICRKCGKYFADINAHTETAKIIEVCRYCFDN